MLSFSFNGYFKHLLEKVICEVDILIYFRLSPPRRCWFDVSQKITKNPQKLVFELSLQKVLRSSSEKVWCPQGKFDLFLRASHFFICMRLESISSK